MSPKLLAALLAGSGFYLLLTRGRELSLFSPIDRRYRVAGVWGDDRSSVRAGAVHKGIDIPAPKGTPVYSVAPGRIQRLSRADVAPAGRLIAIIHDLPGLGDIGTRYLHLDSIPSGLKVGDTVEAGQVIGYVGTSGTFHSGPHLHLDVHAKDPGRYKAVFGPMPSGGQQWIEGFTPVPAEPLIPVGYEAEARKRAEKRGIAVYEG